MIAFVGSVFSPYYHWRGRLDPEDHCAINVALYGRPSRWAMRERGRGEVERGRDAIRIGESGLVWDGAGLDIDIDERGAPLPRPLRGHIRLDAEALNGRAFALHGKHLWRPIVPFGRVRAEFSEPEIKWTGSGYFDMNRGDEPLEAAFRRWTWSRAHIGDETRVLYDAERRLEGPLSLSLGFGADGAVREREAPPRVDLARSRWGVARQTRSEGPARIVQSYEDTPFYARDRVGHSLDGAAVQSMHESLDLDRYSRAIVKAMLPFRMPRW